MLYTCRSGLLCLAEHANEETPTNIVVSFSIFRLAFETCISVLSLILL